MQTVIKGYSVFYHGSFKDKETEKVVDFYQLGILEVNPETGIQLIKVKVPSDRVNDASKLGGQNVEVLCDMKVFQNKTDFVFSKGKAAA